MTRTPDKTAYEAVTPRDAAELLKVSESTILRLIRSGKMKAIRVGRQWRILLKTLEKGTARRSRARQ